MDFSKVEKWQIPDGEVYQVNANDQIIWRKKFNLTLAPSPENDGECKTSGRYFWNTTQNITANPSSNYRFVRWSNDGNQTQSITINKDISLTAFFELSHIEMTLSFYCLDDTTYAPVKPTSISINNTIVAVSFNETTGLVSTTFKAMSDDTINIRIVSQYYVTSDKSYIMSSICGKNILLSKIKSPYARIILRWADSPEDDDSHLKVYDANGNIEKYHLSYKQKRRMA